MFGGEYLIGGAIFLLLVAGCSGATSIAPSTFVPAGGFANTNAAVRVSPQLPASAEATAGEIFVSDILSDGVNVFHTGGEKIATIGGIGSPEGLASDTSGDLYVADFYGNNVLEFASDGKTLLATFSDKEFYPNDVDVDSESGLVGVTGANTRGGAGRVDFFTARSATRCRAVSTQPYYFVSAGAFDRGKFYVVGETSYNASLIGVIASPGCAATKIRSLTFANTIVGVAAIRITPAGRIAVLDAGTSTIYTYDPPVDGNLGQPVATTQLNGLRDPRSFAFSQHGAFVYVTDPYYFSTYTFAYPAGGNALRTISTGASEGITFFPTARS
jgi:hypothetical protein